MRPKTLTSVDKEVLELIKTIPDPDNWFYPGVLPHYIKNPSYRCERLVEMGFLEWRTNGPLPSLGREYRKIKEKVQELENMKNYDLISHLERQRLFSLKTFGPGIRTQGVIDHIRKELREIEKAPDDLEEWVDVMMLACDGAWRAGFEPAQIAAAFEAKLSKNENRDWPDWRSADPNKAIEHVRTGV